MFEKLILRIKIGFFKLLRSKAIGCKDDIHQLAFQHGIDRRRHPRVNFPKTFSFSQIPYFEYKGIHFDIVDLSKGGVCLYDPDNSFNLPLSQEAELFWVSPQRKEKILLQVVGASFQKKHLEFKAVSADLSFEIESFLESGVWGQKMHRSVLSSHSHLETSIVELWIGIHGTNLRFQADPHFVAALEGPHFQVHFYKGSLPVYSENGPEKGRILYSEERIKLLFFLANFPTISSRLNNLLDDWALAEQEHQERAG